MRCCEAPTEVIIRRGSKTLELCDKHLKKLYSRQGGSYAKSLGFPALPNAGRVLNREEMYDPKLVCAVPGCTRRPSLDRDGVLLCSSHALVDTQGLEKQRVPPGDPAGAPGENTAVYVGVEGSADNDAHTEFTLNIAEDDAEFLASLD